MIYLKRELADQELLSLQQHLETCPSCALLASEVLDFQERVNSVADQEVKPSNAAQLTSAIMSAVQVSKAGDISQNKVTIWVHNNLLRYSLATVSLILLISFGLEFQYSTTPVSTRYQQTNAVVILDSDIIQYKPLNKQGKTGFAVCKSTFISKLAYLECLKSKYSSI